ncbi:MULTISPECIES: peptidoglycan endopeptidase [Flavobacterium]|uniref:Peptidoglycan endopeptidase n=1 Tax=Flavobacterium hankyongi TaxID=1176532 RepID=A0ABP9A5G9_9FLAO|nr:peptidoglycan endopeptidase [Flavobacterium sp. N1846]
MKLQKLLTLFLFVITNVVFSQENIKHSVSKGESVYSIAQKYNVKPAEILALNPKAKKTLQLNMVLQIPSKNKVEEKKSETVEHEVAAKETLYGLSKKYNTSIDKIKEANPIIETEGLKIGLKLIIPIGESKVDAVASKKEEKPIQKEEVKKIEKASIVQKEEVKEVSISGEQIVHEVQPKETKYGISKKYGVSIAELESLNPEIKNGLAVGVKLLVKKGSQNENVILENKKETKVAVVGKSEEKPIAEKKVEKKEDKKSGSQFKVIGRVESDKNDEVADVKPQIEESDEEVDETTQTQTEVVEVEPLTPENMTKAEFLISKASENLGARYRSGATGNGGFDCSGLMFSTFKNIEMTLPRSSRDMAANAGVRIDRSQAQKGDLIFFATRGRGVSHVGMITEVAEDEIKFIHSSTSAGVIISSVKEPYYARRFVQINRVLN